MRRAVIATLPSSSSSRLHSANPPQFHQVAAPRVCAGSASGKASEGPSGSSDGSCARRSQVDSTVDPFSTGFDSARKIDGSRRSLKAAAVEAALDH